MFSYLFIYLENPCNGFFSGRGVERARLEPIEVFESGDEVALVFHESGDGLRLRRRRGIEVGGTLRRGIHDSGGVLAAEEEGVVVVGEAVGAGDRHGDRRRLILWPWLPVRFRRKTIGEVAGSVSYGGERECSC